MVKAVYFLTLLFGSKRWISCMTSVSAASYDEGKPAQCQLTLYLRKWCLPSAEEARDKEAQGTPSRAKLPPFPAHLKSMVTPPSAKRGPQAAQSASPCAKTGTKPASSTGAANAGGQPSASGLHAAILQQAAKLKPTGRRTRPCIKGSKHCSPASSKAEAFRRPPRLCIERCKHCNPAFSKWPIYSNAYKEHAACAIARAGCSQAGAPHTCHVPNLRYWLTCIIANAQLSASVLPANLQQAAKRKPTRSMRLCHRPCRLLALGCNTDCLNTAVALQKRWRCSSSALKFTS